MRTDESAVSAVVGAVLLLALFSSAMTIYTVSTLPQWKADKEEIQQQRVAASLGDLRSSLEALAARDEEGPVTATVPLKASRVPLLQQTPGRGSLGLADGFDATFSFPSTPSLFVSGGSAVSSPTAALSTAPCTAKCVASVRDLVVGLATSGIASGNSASITLTVTDSAGTPATVTATIAHTGSTGSCAGDLRLTVGTTVHFIEPCTGGTLASAGALYRVDLLDDDYTFASSIARLTTPLQFAFTSATAGTGSPAFTGSGYTMVFTDDDGLLRTQGTGVSTATPLPDIDGLRLLYSPSYFAYPGQELSFEGGGVLVDAGSTLQAMSADPSFAIAVNSGVGSLDWTLIELSGAQGAVSGGESATVSVTLDSVQDVVLVTPTTCNPCTAITLDTPLSAGWANHLTLRTGLANTGSAATVTSGTDTATLSLASGAGHPVTSGWVLHLRVLRATVTVT